ncbi:MAG TPA: heme-binding protein [Planctomycetaceae bacterium]|nr:heme-binding protein [Planctomycetaceae bacterium]
MNRTVCILLALSAYASAATPQVDLDLPPGFVAEIVYEVPNKEQGSWIAMAVDNKGRLVTSAQSGSLYRLTLNQNAAPIVEEIALPIGRAMGLLYHRDVLYVMVNGKAASGPGLYAVTDTDGDDVFDSVELLRAIEPGAGPGAGHGNHAIVPSPDGESLYLICGNMAGIPKGDFDGSRVPRHWDEDLLLPRIPDSRGHAAKTMAPGGWVARTDLKGEHWELVCCGFRNIYDAAFNRQGDLFTFDADMEFDIGTPWYRPTRICHVVSGGEYGWRSGSGKWPTWYFDSLPPVHDVGPGSPTGMVFGYQTSFPAPWNNRLFLCDWSYGRIFAADVVRNGASYRAHHRIFASTAPLPVVDLVANPHDGAMYFVTGGRGVQSHVYRIRYVPELAQPDDGNESIPVPAEGSATLHELRATLESMHQPGTPDFVDAIWPNLRHADRNIRFAARIALEHQPVKSWSQRALSEQDPASAIPALLALIRVNSASSTVAWSAIESAVDRFTYSRLSSGQQLELLRVIGVLLARSDLTADKAIPKLRGQLLEAYSDAAADVNTIDARHVRELSQLATYLSPARSLPDSLRLLAELPSEVDQFHVAATIRNVREGWTDAGRVSYYQWLSSARGMTGGRSNGVVVKQIKDDADQALSDKDRKLLAELLIQFEAPLEQAPTETRPVVGKWKLTDLISAKNVPWDTFSGTQTTERRGRELFAAATCVRCHRVRGRGGVVGPDLSSLSRRFSPHDALEAILHPEKSVPSDYRSVTVVTVEGKAVTGQVVNLSAKSVGLRTDALNPSKLTQVPQADIEEIVPSTTSLMPAGLLNTLTVDEVHELLSWLSTTKGQ